MLFTLRHVIGLTQISALPGQDGLPELMDPILGEAAKLAEGVLAPLNTAGDKGGAVWKDGSVTTAKGWKEAYNAYRDGGWNAVPFSPDHGGQGLPWVMAFPVQEMWQAANMAFGLCPLLNQGAVEAIAHHGAKDLQDYYLPKLVSGEWTGTMNLTEPQAGSDLAAVRTKAERTGDGTYKIFGSKIFITYGEHDLADNIIHLVLARLPDGPAGVKGISLFIVPKFLKEGTRNDLTCASIEHKLGIHGSPTCTMSFGDKGGAVGYLVGAEHEGIKYMFTMMNNARLSVGLQGVAIADRATQKAIQYAKDRVQGGAKPIIEHADVKRMILTMQACTSAGRMMAYDAAYHADAGNQGRVELMTPVVKGWCTDRSVDVASLGVQIHGGMGFIEETGAAQYYRDARILPIYEGTNGIQALDLVGRKIMKDNGAALSAWLNEQNDLLNELQDAKGDDFEIIRDSLENGLQCVRDTMPALTPENAGAVAHPFLTLLGNAMAMRYLAKAASEAQKCLVSADFSTLSADQLDHQILLARFFAEHILPAVDGLARTVKSGAAVVNAARL